MSFVGPTIGQKLIGWRQITGPLVRKYIVLFLAVVFFVLLANSLLEIGFFYRDQPARLVVTPS